MTTRDILGEIADARAQMMMRGHERLVLEIGPRTADRFRAESDIADLEDWSDAILGLTIVVRSDMEGFAVRAKEGRQ